MSKPTICICSGVEYSVISFREAPQARVDYKIRIKINGKYYVGDLEMSE